MDVKTLLNAYGLTAKQLSDMYEIPYRSVNQWTAPPDSKNRHDCPPYVLMLLAKALSADLDPVVVENRKNTGAAATLEAIGAIVDNWRSEQR